MARRKKNDEEPKENQDNLNNNSDDTFGLPEVEYEPLKRDEPEPEPTAEAPSEQVEEPVASTPEEPVYEKPYEAPEPTPSTYHEETHHEEEQYVSSYSYEPEKSPVWPKILVIGLLLLLSFGAIYYFAVYQPDQREARNAELREKAAADDARKKQRARELAEKARLDAEKRTADSLANLPKVGSLEVLSGRTGQYYVVVASAIDDDLLTDFANKLVAEGKTVKMLSPTGQKAKFYRLAIDGGSETYADAQSIADGMKGGDFGDQLWVVRY